MIIMYSSDLAESVVTINCCIGHWTKNTGRLISGDHIFLFSQVMLVTLSLHLLRDRV